MSKKYYFNSPSNVVPAAQDVTGMELQITVTTAAGRPTFIVDATTPPDVLRERVLRDYGMQQEFCPHSFCGVLVPAQAAS